MYFKLLLTILQNCISTRKGIEDVYKQGLWQVSVVHTVFLVFKDFANDIIIMHEESNC